MSSKYGAKAELMVDTEGVRVNPSETPPNPPLLKGGNTTHLLKACQCHSESCGCVQDELREESGEAGSNPSRDSSVAALPWNDMAHFLLEVLKGEPEGITAGLNKGKR